MSPIELFQKSGVAETLIGKGWTKASCGWCGGAGKVCMSTYSPPAQGLFSQCPWCCGLGEIWKPPGEVQEDDSGIVSAKEIRQTHGQATVYAPLASTFSQPMMEWQRSSLDDNFIKRNGLGGIVICWSVAGLILLIVLLSKGCSG